VIAAAIAIVVVVLIARAIFKPPQRPPAPHERPGRSSPPSSMARLAPYRGANRAMSGLSRATGR
jgi:hypothetical protein